jgi:hypothetical protein
VSSPAARGQSGPPASHLTYEFFANTTAGQPQRPADVFVWINLPPSAATTGFDVDFATGFGGLFIGGTRFIPDPRLPTFSIVSLSGAKLDQGGINAVDPSTRDGAGYDVTAELDFSTTPGASFYSVFVGPSPPGVSGDFRLVSAIPEPGPLSLACVAAGAAICLRGRRGRLGRTAR